MNHDEPNEPRVERFNPPAQSPPDGIPSRRWMGIVLTLAGLYNLAFGLIAVIWPLAAFDALELPRPNYPQFWQCIGMIVGVYGIGYLIAAGNPLKHWPIVLVGLLGKIFGPIGFIDAAARGQLPWNFGWMILTNDLIWWVPFGLILAAAARRALYPPEPAAERLEPLDAVIRRALNQRGVDLLTLSHEAPRLVVFLRHTGCTFCREALSDLAAKRARIEAAGARIVLVHMGIETQSAETFARYGLADVDRISDPERVLFRAFGLRRGTLRQLFGWQVWVRGVRAAILGGHWVGPLVGDGFQMPGAFVLHHGEIVRAFRHETAADRPDYLELAACELPAAATS